MRSPNAPLRSATQWPEPEVGPHKPRASVQVPLIIRVVPPHFRFAGTTKLTPQKCVNASLLAMVYLQDVNLSVVKKNNNNRR